MLGTLPSGRRSPAFVLVRMPGGDLQCFAAELHADPVLRVAAVDLVADADAGVDVAAAALEEEREAAEVLLDHVAGRTGVVGGGDLRPAADRHRVGGVAEEGGDGVAVEVVDADHADGGVDRVVGYLAEDVAAVAGLSPVDADRALAPATADPGRLQPAVRLDRRLGEPTLEVGLVACPEGDVLGCVRHRHELGQGGGAVVVAQVEEHVRRRDAERPGYGGAQASALGHAHDAEVCCHDRDFRLAVSEDEDRGRQVALDRLDRRSEQAQPGLAGAEERVDRAACDAGVKCRSHRSPSRGRCLEERRGAACATPLPASDPIAAGYELSHAVRRPVLKSLNAT